MCEVKITRVNTVNVKLKLLLLRRYGRGHLEKSHATRGDETRLHEICMVGGAADRSFIFSEPSPRTVDLRYDEQFKKISIRSVRVFFLLLITDHDEMFLRKKKIVIKKKFRIF